MTKIYSKKLDKPPQFNRQQTLKDKTAEAYLAMSALKNMLLSSKEYRLHYVRYKVHVEHRSIPDIAMRQLPADIAQELQELWSRENINRSHEKKLYPDTEQTNGTQKDQW